MHPILNHLIAQNPDTRTALARHSGRRIALSATGLRLAGVITDEGYLAASGGEADMLQMSDSTIIRAHHCAAGGRGGPKVRLSAARAAASRPSSTCVPMPMACPSASC